MQQSQAKWGYKKDGQTQETSIQFQKCETKNHTRLDFKTYINGEKQRQTS